jgi:hypothetical protein
MKITVRVYHSYFGCDTGCCGHRVELTVDDKSMDVGNFEFGHPYNEDLKEWATALAKEEIQRECPECLESIDWDTIDFQEVSED